MTHALGDLLLAVGTALVLVDLLLATSAGQRATRVRLRLQAAFPRMSQGLAVLLVTAAGVGVISLGLDLVTRT